MPIVIIGIYCFDKTIMNTSSEDIVYKNLSSKVRWAKVFVSKSTIEQQKVSKKIIDNLHALVSSSMQQVYAEHIAQKSTDLFETLKDRELVYIDAEKKWDMDLFTYITQQYFNLCSEDIRWKYNRSIYASYPERFDGESWSSDGHFQRSVDQYKTYPQRKEEWSDMLIWFMPLHDISMLMFYNQQQDFNIFLDNIHNITPAEMWILNNAIRAWLLVSSEQRIGLYINNLKDTRNFIEWAEHMPPQAGHDMKMIYL